MLLECCVDCVESAVTAAEHGADRLELCANLLIGGTTPDINLFYRVKKKIAHTNTKINVLLRPRFGDFCYSEDEFAVLLADVQLFREAGADGVVIGVLNKDGSIDEERMALLMEAAGELPVTFHRAFDVCRDPLEALETCKRLGISTILTSGQKSAAMEGLELLKKLVDRAGTITIMPGSGVSSHNLEQLLNCGAKAYHMSAKKVVESPMSYRKEGVPMGLPMMSEFTLWRCDGEEVARAKAILTKAGECCDSQ